MLIIDTNVLSEVLKPAPSVTVAGWLDAQDRSAVFITSITVAEILYGIESLPQGRRRSQLLARAEEMIEVEYRGHILAFDETAARAYAQIVVARTTVGRPIAHFDAMIAAIARAHHFTVATRDTAGFQHSGVRLINPWRES